MPSGSAAPSRRFLKRSRTRTSDFHGNPTEPMANLFDIALLIGVGLLIMSLRGMGLNDMLSKSDVTIVKNPGKIDMEIIQRTSGTVHRLRATGNTAGGVGRRIGSVYRLEDGQVVWLPETEVSAQTTGAP